MNTGWKETKLALNGFFALLACGKCKRTPDRPIRFVNCGHFFCDDCVQNVSVCVQCHVPIRPQEMQPHHMVAQLIQYCRTIQETVADINVEDLRHLAEAMNLLAVDKDKTLYFLQEEEKDLDSETLGFVEFSQQVRSKVCEPESVDYVGPSQINPCQKQHNVENECPEKEEDSETPGFIEPTPVTNYHGENNFEPETAGYIDSTQAPKVSKLHNKLSKEKQAKSASSERKLPKSDNRWHEKMAVETYEHIPDSINDDIIVPESLENIQVPSPSSSKQIIIPETLQENTQCNKDQPIEPSIGFPSSKTAEMLSTNDSKSVKTYTRKMKKDDVSSQQPKTLKNFPTNTMSIAAVTSQCLETQDIADKHFVSAKTKRGNFATKGCDTIQETDQETLEIGDARNFPSKSTVETEKSPGRRKFTRVKLRERRPTPMWINSTDTVNTESLDAETSGILPSGSKRVEKDHSKIKDFAMEPEEVAPKNKMYNLETSKKKSTEKIRERANTKANTSMKAIPKNINKRNAKGETALHTACVKTPSSRNMIQLFKRR